MRLETGKVINLARPKFSVGRKARIKKKSKPKFDPMTLQQVLRQDGSVPDLKRRDTFRDDLSLDVMKDGFKRMVGVRKENKKDAEA